VGKSGVLQHESGNISETRKDRGKVTMEGPGTDQRSFERYHPDPLRPPLPQDWGFVTPPKTSIAIISGTGKAMDFKFGRHIHRIHPNKSLLIFWRKGSVGVSRDCPIFQYSLLSQNKRTSNFVRTFIGLIGTKAH